MSVFNITALAAGHATTTTARGAKRRVAVLAAGLASASATHQQIFTPTVAIGGTSTAAASRGARRGIVVRADGVAGASTTSRVRSYRSAAPAGHATVSAGIDFVHAGSHLTQLGVEVVSAVMPPAYLSMGDFYGHGALVIPIVADSCSLTYSNAADLAHAKDGTQRGVFFNAPVQGNRRVWKVTTDFLSAADAQAIQDLIAASPLCVAAGYWIQSAVAAWVSGVESTPINGPGGATLETLTFTLTEAY